MCEALAACEGALLDSRNFLVALQIIIKIILFSNFCSVCYYYINYYANLIN